MILNYVLYANCLTAGLLHRDKQLALTAVDYSKNPGTMFQQMINALENFLGSRLHVQGVFRDEKL